MFDNIGGKIKTLAKAQFGIGVVAFCIAGISVMSVGNVLLGILTIGLGLLGSWIGSFFTYGLGELIETAKELNQNMVQLRNDISEVQRFSKEKESKASVSVPTPKVISKREPAKPDPNKVYEVVRSENGIICPFCGQAQKPDRNMCWNCGAKFTDKK